MNQSSLHERPNLTDDDLELLNAALDDELTPTQQEQLHTRLAAEAVLAEEFAELRATRRLVRALPFIQPPRSFTLAAAPARRGGWFARFHRTIWLRTFIPAAAVMVLALIWPSLQPAPPQLLTSLDATVPAALSAEQSPAAAMALEPAVISPDQPSAGMMAAEAPIAGEAAAGSTRMADPPAGAPEMAAAAAVPFVEEAATADSAAVSAEPYSTESMPAAADTGAANIGTVLFNPIVIILAAVVLAAIAGALANSRAQRRR